MADLHDLYREKGETTPVQLADGTPADVRRYDALGMAFEIQGARVKAVALYPPAK